MWIIKLYALNATCQQQICKKLYLFKRVNAATLYYTAITLYYTHTINYSGSGLSYS